MKLIDRFVSRELLVNVAFAIAVLSLVLVVGNIFRKLLPLLVNLAIENTISSFSQREGIVGRMSFSLRVVFPNGRNSD
jgi:hypothetical protein